MVREERLAKARNTWEAMPHGNAMADRMLDINTQSEVSAKTMSSKERAAQRSLIMSGAVKVLVFLSDHAVAPGTHCGDHSFFKMSGRHVCLGRAQVMVRFSFM